jgi:hypothetical protein
MKFLIDTSSLLALVRYYLPFEKEDLLKDFIKTKINQGEIIILDKVFEESNYVSKGIIIKELSFLKYKSRHFKTDELLPQPKFFRILDNQLSYGVQKNKLSEVEYESNRNQFLESADAKLVLFCLDDQNSLGLDKPMIVTEETQSENDNKLFKKLPSICTILEINHCTLPELLKEYFAINLCQYLE